MWSSADASAPSGCLPRLRLLQLRRITKEDDTLGRVRYGQHVCERYLPGFVNEQNIHSLGKLLRGP